MNFNMKKVIKLTESDLARIVKRVIREQNDQQLQESKEVILTPNVFPPGLYQPFNPTNEDLAKLSELVTWINSPNFKNKKMTVTITAGSSKIPPSQRAKDFSKISDPKEYNIWLAGERGKTGINWIKQYLSGKIPEDLFKNIEFKIDTSAAYQGPEYKNDPTNKVYLDYQFVKVTAKSSGVVEPGTGIGQKVLYRAQKLTDRPNLAIIYFCVNGNYPLSQCKEEAPVYYSNGFEGAGVNIITEVPKGKMRWVPIEGIDKYDIIKGQPLTNNKCFQYEYSYEESTNKQQREECPKIINNLPNFAYKFFKNEVPGPEVGDQLHQEIKKYHQSTTR